MSTNNIPAFELEKSAVQTDVENGLADGIKCLHNEAPDEPRDHFHNTRYLLRQFRRVTYAIKVSEADLSLRMEIEHGVQMSALEVNAELAGVDLSGSKLESYSKSIVRSRKMIKIIENALDTVRLDPDHGELLYQILYLTYFTERKPQNREVILNQLDRIPPWESHY